MRPASHSAPIHPLVGTSSTVNSEVANAYASQFEGTLPVVCLAPLSSVSAMFGAQSMQQTWL